MARSSGCAASVVALAAYTMSMPAWSQTWKISPSLGLQETITNNVELSPPATRQSDFVTQITPGLIFSERGARTKLDGVVSVPVLLYVRTGAENDSVYPSANILGDVAIVQDFFHVAASANVAQQFFSPFGAQPNDLSNAAFNRYRSQTYSVSPYIAGVLEDGARYQLRNNNVWTILSGAPVNLNNSDYTQVIANLDNDTRQVGYRAHYEFGDIRFSDGSNIRTQLGRAGPVWNPEPQLRLFASVGYEQNDYAFTSSQGAIYGGGLEWNPTERTHAVALYEHRFFGPSYIATFNHRTPLSEWSLSATRNITTYPQQLATVPVGLDVAGFLNGLLLSSIPDPVARQDAVNQLIAQRGLPTTLITPVNVYTQQILLQQSETATVALIGARNTILLTVYNVKSEPITAAGTVLPPLLGLDSNNTQTGGSIVWTTRLTSSLNLTTTVNGYRTVSNESRFPGSTRQGIAQTTLSTSLSPRTVAFIGARYQLLKSNVVSEYNEAAAMIGVSYTYQ